jgi:hypothetical protein
MEWLPENKESVLADQVVIDADSASPVELSHDARIVEKAKKAVECSIEEGEELESHGQALMLSVTKLQV